jgi:hypothetical protein
MLRNYSFLVKPVKDQPPNAPTQPIDYHDLARVVTKSVVTCISVYVGADTVRRIVIYAISAKF